MEDIINFPVSLHQCSELHSSVNAMMLQTAVKKYKEVNFPISIRNFLLIFSILFGFFHHFSPLWKVIKADIYHIDGGKIFYLLDNNNNNINKFFFAIPSAEYYYILLISFLSNHGLQIAVILTREILLLS